MHHVLNKNIKQFLNFAINLIEILRNQCVINLPIYDYSIIINYDNDNELYLK